MWEEFDR